MVGPAAASSKTAAPRANRLTVPENVESTCESEPVAISSVVHATDDVSL